MKYFRILAVIAVSALFVGCSGHWFCDCRSVVAALPPLPPPPIFDTPQWSPPAWWNGIDGTNCLVHHVDRIEEIVPIAYGFPMANSPEYDTAQTNLFPNTWRSAPGGCVIAHDSPTHRMVRFCPMCRQAEDSWLKTNDRYNTNSVSSGPAHANTNYTPRTNDVLYTVLEGDCLLSVAAYWNVSLSALKERNRISSVSAGQILVIPAEEALPNITDDIMSHGTVIIDGEDP